MNMHVICECGKRIEIDGDVINNDMRLIADNQAAELVRLRNSFESLRDGVLNSTELDNDVINIVLGYIDDMDLYTEPSDGEGGEL